MILTWEISPATRPWTEWVRQHLNSPEGPETPSQFISWAEQRFDEAGLYYGHGTNNARDEAAWLVLGALGLLFDPDDELPGQTLEPALQKRLVDLVNRRIKERIPVAYLLNEAWFCGLPFYVDERVLIPRSPVAELIEERFCPWIEPDRVRRILDIGTGSACIAVASALAFPAARVDALELSSAALDVARKNVQKYGLEQRLTIHQSDLFEKAAGQNYDIIIANPPYVDAEDMRRLPAEYLHEPGQALAAGEDGLELVRRILEQSADYLTESGILVVEVGNSQVALERAFPQVPFLWLEFELGGHGVFLLTAEQLNEL